MALCRFPVPLSRTGLVATEVRGLAQRSTGAAKEIKQLIAASAGQVQCGVKLVGETGEALARIVAQVSEITTALSGIAGSAGQQADALHEVNTAIREIDGTTQQNVAMVDESRTASHALAQDTEQLAGLTSRFRLVS
jgi:methyl-accepting chemotaxis protein